MYRHIIVALIVLTYVAVGSVNQHEPVPYFVLLFTIGAILLVLFGKIKVKYLPIYIFTISLAILWQNTMLGTYLVGNDLNREYLLAMQAYNNGWDPAGYTVYMSNTSVVIGVVAPFISKVFHIDMVWVFKAVIPLFLAAVPLILYYAFSKQFGNKRAFYATIFFVIMPVFSMEISTITKSMVAELFFALMILAVVSELSRHKKGVAIMGCMVGMLFTHYTIAIIAAMYLVGMIVISVISRWQAIGEYIGHNKFPTIAVSLVLVSSLFTGYVYYSQVSNGAVIQSIERIAGWVGDIPQTQTWIKPTGGGSSEPIEPSETATPSEPSKPSTPIEPSESVSEPSEPSEPSETEPNSPIYLAKQPPMVRAGIGLDFMDSTSWGKTFRVVQYATQFLIVIGAVFVIKNRKKYNFSNTFIAGIIASFILLTLCIFVPNFSRIINMTRFYHLALFFLAPLLIVGLEGIFRRRWEYVVAPLLCVYLLFTSGFVYEAIDSEVVNRVDLPYSSAFSADRTGLVAIYSENDIECAKWIAGQDYLVAGDVNAILLVSGYVEAIPRLKPSITESRYDMNNPESGTLIFLTEWNIQNQKAIIPINVGLRDYQDIPKYIYDTESYPPLMLDDDTIFEAGAYIVYRSGNSFVYLYTENPTRAVTLSDWYYRSWYYLLNQIG